MNIASPINPAQTASLFGGLQPQPADVLLSITKAFQADERPGKIDLGVGVYRDARGRTPVFAAVKAAEAQLLASQSTKTYLGPEGDVGFLERIAEVIFGPGPIEPDMVAMQTPGGTGALRLAAELANAARPGCRIWLGQPSWPIHAPIFAAAGLKVESYVYFRPTTQQVEFDDLIEALKKAQAGDVCVLHACCHNPSGADLTLDQWRTVAKLISARGLVPLIDFAYQGLGDGLEEDARGLRLVLDAVDDAFVAYSCDKNFGLYRERTGALFVKSRGHADLARSNLMAIGRTIWSMPPDHGAAVVRIILESESLTQIWRDELTKMRTRLNDLRDAVAAAEPSLAWLRAKRGLFAILPLTPAQVDALRRDSGLYMAGSGRINLAGLNDATLWPFIQAVSSYPQDPVA